MVSCILLLRHEFILVVTLVILLFLSSPTINTQAFTPPSSRGFSSKSLTSSRSTALFSTISSPTTDAAATPITAGTSTTTTTTTTTTTETTLTRIPTLDQWSVLPDGRIEGIVSNHPAIEDGAVIKTSPLNLSRGTIPLMSHHYQNAQNQQFNDEDDNDRTGIIIVETYSGSQYILRNPSFVDTARQQNVANDSNWIISSSTHERNDKDDDDEEEGTTISETKKLMEQVKDAGIAGVISYAAWELGFWTISVPFCIVAYRQLTGHWPNFDDQEDIQKLGAEAFAFVNVARFAVPLRIGLALGTTPWVQSNIVDRFLSSGGGDDYADKEAEGAETR